ncbi:hypothetical protein RSOLAG22IIIB_13042 [Rhizoctonia solani]|uniref:Tetrapyrrole methylase domain-containing protein n=1 Tax=Rhizoctonia solani TaxID=456999 RepID=A0A0K6GI33_9AGAM|nr:hypothetical protein RSOLAG22IIIB_13042 [Rhizoctonia solani]
MSPTGNSTISKSGSLIIAGSGIASVAQMTLETVAHLKHADKVFYLVNDPVTEAFIKEHNSEASDLLVFYDKAKPRYHSYVEMTEVMLREVRAGHKVLGIFYGHPGVFVHPSHRAITIAREEGYEAKMLPGVSAEDYMFADLGFDPCVFGCMSSEATELIAHNRSLDTSVHNIIWQVGGIGVGTLEYEKSKFHLLVDRLERDFGPNHKVVHYIGAIRMTPQANSAMVVYTIEELRNPEIAKFIGSASSLYVPPRDIAPVHEPSATKLGLPPVLTGILAASPKWVGSRFVCEATSGKLENDIISKLDQHVPPAHYKALRATPAMKKFMIDLALEPKLQEAYKASPEKSVASVNGLTEIEKHALLYGLDSPISKVMSRSSPAEPTKESLEAVALLGDAIMHITAAGVAV